MIDFFVFVFIEPRRFVTVKHACAHAHRVYIIERVQVESLNRTEMK